MTAPLTAAGTRSSAPDSSSEELVTAEPDKETGATRANRCQATCSDSEELIPTTESRQEDGLWPQQAADTFAFPAPLPGAQGGPEGWNQLPIVHVNKRLLQWWSQPPQAKVNTPSPSAFLRAFFLTRPDANGLSIFDRLKGPGDSCFEGFDRFATTDVAVDCSTHEELLVGFHGTHPHTLWSIMRAGMAESGPGTPGSRFFQLPKSDGTTADVSGIYCFQQALYYKCLYYAVAVLFQAEPDAPRDSGPTAIRLVIELSFFRSDINKRGKRTDQCIVQKAAVRAIHVQVALAKQLELGEHTR